MKKHRLKATYSWVYEFSKQSHSFYHLEKLASKDINLDLILSKMSEKQLAVVNALITSCHSYVYDKCREQQRRDKIDKAKWARKELNEKLIENNVIKLIHSQPKWEAWR